MKKDVKYALFCYKTENIGDEIQSIAAKRFLPKVDYYIDRDNIDATTFQNNEEVKLIMNGWFLHPASSDRKIHWPPHNPALNPLITSMHISSIVDATKYMKTPESYQFFRKFAPIGARDTATKAYFESLGIPSYFSGCLTLTLIPDPNVEKQDFVLAVDVESSVIDALKKRTDRPIVQLSVNRTFSLPDDEKFALATYWLFLYQSAHCVITSRLHAILPALVFNTPVIAVDIPDPDRYSGLLDLANHYSTTDFIDHPEISVDYPQKNPTTYKKLRDQLVKTCTAYTGYDSKQSYFGRLTPSEFFASPAFVSAISDLSNRSFHNEIAINDLNRQLSEAHSVNHELSSQIENLNREIKHLNLQIEKLNSRLVNPNTIIPGVKDSSKILLKSLNNHFHKKPRS